RSAVLDRRCATTAMEICGRDGRMLAARVEQKNGMQPDWRDAPLTKKAPYKPYAGEPPVRFGGRGRRKSIPTPIITTESGCGQSWSSSFAQHEHLWLWVPAFAGTTSGECTARTSGECTARALRQQHRVRAGHGFGAVRHRLL